MNIPYKSLKRSFGEKVCACGCGTTFTSTHWKQKFAHETHALKVHRAKDAARRVKIKRDTSPKAMSERRRYHELRMTTVRVVRGITLQPGFDICQRTGCDEVYLVDDSRRIYCGPRCRHIAGNSRRCWRREANTQAVEERKPIARRAVGLIHTPELTEEPVARGMADDEGIDGQLPWEHSWSGADPLPV
jgi:hypothetical protein